ncbi:MAG: hypothetical protein R6X20_01530 [Phycisphaerae bacterium]
MDETALREKVGQLLLEVQRKPGRDRGAEAAAGGGGGASGSAMKRDMATLEDNLDHVRLAVKYLLFDLEATKRENLVLRELLGDG